MFSFFHVSPSAELEPSSPTHQKAKASRTKVDSLTQCSVQRPATGLLISPSVPFLTPPASIWSPTSSSPWCPTSWESSSSSSSHPLEFVFTPPNFPAFPRKTLHHVLTPLMVPMVLVSINNIPPSNLSLDSQQASNSWVLDQVSYNQWLVDPQGKVPYKRDIFYFS